MERKELVPVQRRLPVERQRSGLPQTVARVSRSLALFARSPLVRRAATVGLAFGAGWRLSKALRESELTRLTRMPDVTRPGSRGCHRDYADAAEPSGVVWVRRSFVHVSVTRLGRKTRDE